MNKKILTALIVTGLVTFGLGTGLGLLLAGHRAEVKVEIQVPPEPIKPKKPPVKLEWGNLEDDYKDYDEKYKNKE